MIEDKKLGLKIAENPLEEMWKKVVDARKESIENLKQSLIIEKAFLEKAKIELAKSVNK